MSKNNGQDYIADGFYVIDEKYIEHKPPKIKWGFKYKKWTDKEKIKYLEEFACSMNQAAFLVQGDRDKLNALILVKENQLKQMSKAMAQNNTMLNSEIQKMNEQRQGFRDAIKKLDTEIRELKDAANH